MYSGQNAVSNFLEDILRKEEEIRKILAHPKQVKMTQADWEKFKTASDCHIYGKSLVKEEFLDSLPVWLLDEGIDDYRYWGQSHKRCYYENKKSDFYPMKLKRVAEQADKDRPKKLNKCLFCRKPMMLKNFRDAVKNHCHITGEFRGTAHSACNNKLRIKPKTMAIPVVFHNLRGYDAHHLMQAMSQYKKELTCITFTMGNVRFIDSLSFLLSSLNILAKSTQEKS